MTTATIRPGFTLVAFNAETGAVGHCRHRNDGLGNAYHEHGQWMTGYRSATAAEMALPECDICWNMERATPRFGPKVVCPVDGVQIPAGTECPYCGYQEENRG